ncbi:MAG: pilin [Patescibacteria group bacterium]
MAYKIQQKNRQVLVILVFVILLFSLLSISGAIPHTQAQGNAGKTYTLLEPLPCIPTPGSNQVCDNGQVKNIDLGSFFSYAFNLLIALSAVAAVFMMVYGGFLYMTTDSWQQSKAGLEKFKNAIYGLLMVLAAFLILKTVNPKLVAIPASITIPKDVQDKINKMKQSPTALFDQLNKEAAQFDADIASAKSNIIWDQELIAGFDEDIQDIEDEIMSKYPSVGVFDSILSLDDICKDVLKWADDPEMYDLCAQRAQKIAARDKVTGDIGFQTIKGVSDSLVRKCQPTGRPEYCDNLLESFGKTTRMYYLNNPELFNNEEQRNQSANYILYSKAVIEITKQQALVYQASEQDLLDFNVNLLGGTTYKRIDGTLMTEQEALSKAQEDSYKAINKIVNDYTATPNYDPELLKQLQEKKKIAEQDIKNTKFHTKP